MIAAVVILAAAIVLYRRSAGLNRLARSAIDMTPENAAISFARPGA